jgi:hypothetical protein
MTDLEKAEKVLLQFRKALENGYSSHDSSHEAIEGHMNGYERGEYGEILLAYCGSYMVLLKHKGQIYK